MNGQLIYPVVSELEEIIVNITRYVRENPDKITWLEGEQLKQLARDNAADALDLPQLQAILDYGTIEQYRNGCKIKSWQAHT